MLCTKREDLQGIRGIAVISVVIFHFFPSQYPNGLLGVDMFFVLSGYFISQIASSEVKLDFSTVMKFYYRRIKRILPLYGVVILFTILSLLFVFPNSYLWFNISRAYAALFFYKNINYELSEGENYANILQQAQDIFTHTWSLAVEIQFYILAPLVFIFITSSLRTAHISIAIIGLLSLAFHIYVDRDTAFYCILARIWQFSIGILTRFYLHEDKVLPLESPSPSINHSSSFFSTVAILALLVQLFYPTKLNEIGSRFLISALSGCLIVHGSTNQPFFLRNRPLTYVGDISYALYLVHWPIYVFIRYMYQTDNTALLCGIAISFATAIFLFHLLEKSIILMEKAAVFQFVGVAYILTLGLLLFASRPIKPVKIEELKMFSSNKTTRFPIQQILRLNEEMNRADHQNLFHKFCSYRDENQAPFGWCDMKLPNSSQSNNIRMMLIGNSYAPTNAALVYDNCQDIAKEIVMYSRGGSEVLTISEKLKESKEAYHDYFSAVNTTSPDVLFILVRLMSFMETPLNGSLTEDVLYQEASKRLRQYESIVAHRIYILDAFPRPRIDMVTMVHRDVSMGRNINNSLLADPTVSQSSARLRLSSLAAGCSKCRLIDYVPPLTKDGQFQFADSATGLVHFTSGLHLTSIGLEKLNHLYASICSKP